MDISTNLTSQACQIPGSDVLVLEGHTSEVWPLTFSYYVFPLFIVFIFSLISPSVLISS